MLASRKRKTKCQGQRPVNDRIDSGPSHGYGHLVGLGMCNIIGYILHRPITKLAPPSRVDLTVAAERHAPIQDGGSPFGHDRAELVGCKPPPVVYESHLSILSNYPRPIREQMAGKKLRKMINSERVDPRN
jgi:hypothetical protein